MRMPEALFIILAVEVIPDVLLCKSGIPQFRVMSAVGIIRNAHILTPNALSCKVREVKWCLLVFIAVLRHLREVKSGRR